MITAVIIRKPFEGILGNGIYREVERLPKSQKISFKRPNQLQYLCEKKEKREKGNIRDTGKNSSC